MNVFDNIVPVKHWVWESSRLGATNYYGHMADLKIEKDGGRDNGEIVAAGALDTVNGVQVRVAKDAVAGQPLYLLLTPPFGYDTTRKGRTAECYFYNEKDEVARAYELQVHDIFTIPEEAITALGTAPVVGNYVSWDPTTRKYVESATLPTGICACQIMDTAEHFNFAAATQSVSYRLQVMSL